MWIFILPCCLNILTLWIIILLFMNGCCQSRDQPSIRDEFLTMIVMDPLSLPLSCPSVGDFAQRDFQLLADHLEKQLDRPIKLHFNGSLNGQVLGDTSGRADVIIGKSSTVRVDASVTQRNFSAVAKLTDAQGSTTQHGLIVVASNDPAQKIEDLKEYRFFFGPIDCDEEHQAVKQLFLKHGFQMPVEEPFFSADCCFCATAVLESHERSIKAATVISSYAARLLEGCGTVPLNSLRVIAKTEPVPFIQAFVCSDLGPTLKRKITESLLSVGDDSKLCIALESKIGFVSIEDSGLAEEVKNPTVNIGETESKLRSQTVQRAVGSANRQTPIISADEVNWTGWRGKARDAKVSKLPQNPTVKPKVVWKFPLVNKGLGGIAATEDLVLFGDRDVDDKADVWRCLDAVTGAELWKVKVTAVGSYDYGNSPRTTPLIVDDNAYLLGASGDLLCVDLIGGEIHWQMNLRKRFGATVELPWGYCGSPLLAEGRLIVAPGAPDASLVALEPATGKVLWKTPGSGPAHGSLIVASLGGKKQIVGHDADSIGGWDLKSGKRLWTVKPKVEGDFNVPTPLELNGQLLITTENNGTRLFAFHDDGTIIPKPVAINRKLNPNMSTPVISGGYLYCVNKFLFCLDINDGLKEKWRIRDRRLSNYASIIASPDQLLIVGDGELLFLPTNGEKEITARHSVSEKKIPIYSHPALVGEHLFIRTESAITCFKWQTE